MTKQEFDQEIIDAIKEELHNFTSAGFLDKPAVRQIYNDTKDDFHKSGMITDRQVNDWCAPDKLLSLNYLKK